MTERQRGDREATEMRQRDREVTERQRGDRETGRRQRDREVTERQRGDRETGRSPSFVTKFYWKNGSYSPKTRPSAKYPITDHP